MRVFVFMLKKSLPGTLLLGAAVTVLGLIFLLVSCTRAWGDRALYRELFSQAEQSGDLGSAQLKGDQLSEEDQRTYRELNDYISSHTKNGVPPVLPQVLVDKAYALRFGDGKAPGSDRRQAAYSLLKQQLQPQLTSHELITERVRGYSRNLRRGVTDQYSLKVAEKMSGKYEQVLTRQESRAAQGTVFDTRSADSFVSFISTELMSLAGVFMLCFTAFSSDLQTGQFRALRLTRTGPRRYTALRLGVGLLQIACFFTLFYWVLAGAAVLMSERPLLSMPVQYLRGFELSRVDLSFGGFLVFMYLLRLMQLLSLGMGMMLLSMVSGRVIPSALLGLAVLAVPSAAKALPLPEVLGQLLSCDIAAMTDDLDLVELAGEPVEVTALFIIGAAVLTLVCGAVTLVISGRRSGNGNG